MDDEMEVLVSEAEATFPGTQAVAFILDDAPLTELMTKAHNIFAGQHWENLDQLACRIADVCPDGVTEENFSAAKPVAGACKKWFSNVEKLRKGLKRPLLDGCNAVEAAAKETVAKAEGTLMPIINAVKSIEDRKKREKEEREAAEAKRILDEAKANLEAEQAAERKRIADEKEANRKEAEQLAAEKKRMADEKAAADAKAKAVNDELAELKRKIAESERKPAELAGKPAKLVPMDSHGYTITANEARADHGLSSPLKWADSPVPPDPQETLQEDWEKARDDEQRDQACDPPASADQQKVREFGLAIASMLVGMKRPAVANDAAKQAIELAVFDMVETAKRLQEWSGT